MNLCYIQARGGSKRFPMKALALWNGIPMLGDAIQKAQATGLFDYIVVSSDSTEILQVAHDYGAMPLWRTAEASSDTATDDDVAREVLAYFPDVEIVCKMYPCIPLLSPFQIYDTFNLVKSNKYKAYDMHYGAYLVDNEDKDAGACYIFYNSAFKILKTIALKTFPWIKRDIDNACDINTPEDLEIAKQKAGK
jgi:CMP-N-acetylneuraminic acid synthetase